MEYTGELEKDITDEQHREAKKTIQIITEFNGHKYVQELDGTQGFAVMVTDKKKVELSMAGTGNTVLNFADTLVDRMPQDVQLIFLAKRTFDLKV